MDTQPWKYFLYDLKRKEDGVGAHFFDHAEELGINFDTDI